MTDRTEVLSSRYTKREARIIQRLAKSQGIEPSIYIRAAVLTATVLDGDLEAMRVLGGYAVKRMAEAGARLLREEELKLESA